IIPGAETPERRAAEHEDLERLGPRVIALPWRWLPGRPQPVLKDGDGLSQEWALAEVHIRLPAVREGLELSIVKWQPGPSSAVFRDHARIWRDLRFPQVLEQEDPAQPQLEKNDHDQGHPEDRPSRLEPGKDPAQSPERGFHGLSLLVFIIRARVA